MGRSGKWIPRAVMVDLEPGTLDVVTASAVGKAFKPDNFVFGNSGAGNNWAKGHYTEGAEIVEQAIDVVSGQLNGDLRKLGVNLIPFPRLHFFNIAQAPLLSPRNSGYTKLFIQELTKQVWSGKQFYSNVQPEDGKYMAANFTFRGNLSTQEVDDNMEKLNSKNADDFVEWIPNNLKTGVITTPPKTSKMSATFVANTTALKGIFQRLATQFGAMYRRKAFLHWYKGEGMDEMEFQEADKNVRDLITEYQDKQDAVVGGDDDE